MRRIFRIISVALLLALTGGSLPHPTCSPAVCEATPMCASMHCACCGPNCPWIKHSRDWQKPAAICNAAQCPLMAASKPVTIRQVRSFVSFALADAQVHPFVIATITPNPPPADSAPTIPSPTLLSLGCALTV